MILTIGLLILTGCKANTSEDDADGKESVIQTQEDREKEGKEK